MAGEQTRFYGRNGSYQGSAFNYGRSTTFTDRNGNFEGTSINHGNSTSFYDRNGHFTGSVTWPSTSSSRPLTGEGR